MVNNGSNDFFSLCLVIYFIEWYNYFVCGFWPR